MILRLLNFVVVVALIFAAVHVYRIKYESTVQAERLAKIRGETRRERDRIAALRAEWGELDNPARIEALAKRYLQLKPIAPTQFDSLSALPDRPQFMNPQSKDPIGLLIENVEDSDAPTGSVARRAGPGAPAASPRPGATLPSPGTPTR